MRESVALNLKALDLNKRSVAVNLMRNSVSAKRSVMKGKLFNAILYSGFIAVEIITIVAIVVLFC